MYSINVYKFSFRVGVFDRGRTVQSCTYGVCSHKLSVTRWCWAANIILGSGAVRLLLRHCLWVVSEKHKNLLKKQGKQKIVDIYCQQWMRNGQDILTVYLNLYDALVTIDISIGIGISMLGIDKIIVIDIYKITKASERLTVHFSFWLKLLRLVLLSLKRWWFPLLAFPLLVWFPV